MRFWSCPSPVFALACPSVEQTQASDFAGASGRSEIRGRFCKPKAKDQRRGGRAGQSTDGESARTSLRPIGDRPFMRSGTYAARVPCGSSSFLDSHEAPSLYSLRTVDVAQSVEHQVVALGVGGSSPLIHPSFCSFPILGGVPPGAPKHSWAISSVVRAPAF